MTFKKEREKKKLPTLIILADNSVVKLFFLSWSSFVAFPRGTRFLKSCRRTNCFLTKILLSLFLSFSFYQQLYRPFVLSNAPGRYSRPDISRVSHFHAPGEEYGAECRGEWKRTRFGWRESFDLPPTFTRNCQITSIQNIRM